MKRLVLCSLAIAALVVAVARPAQATDSRAQSLLYNLAFPDDTDIFLFPQLLPEYRGVYFHLPPDIEGVYGGVILGSQDSAFAAFVHRPWLSPFDQFRIFVTELAAQGNFTAAMPTLDGDPGASVQVDVPGQIFDIMYGARTWGIGVRIHGWSEGSIREGDLAGAGVRSEDNLADPARIEQTAIAADVNAGFRVLAGLQGRVNLGFVFVKETGFGIRSHLGARYIAPGDATMRFVAAGELQFMLWKPDSDDIDSSYAVTLPFKAGARITLVREQLFLGVLAGIDVQFLQYVAPGATDADDARVGLAIPTLEIAAEWLPLDWLRVRTAIKGGYGFQFAGAKNPTTGKDEMPKFEHMTFSSGIGFLVGPFTLDAVIQYNLWHDGPNFLGGGAGLFGALTAAYNY